MDGVKSSSDTLFSLAYFLLRVALRGFINIFDTSAAADSGCSAAPVERMACEQKLVAWIPPSAGLFIFLYLSRAS